MHWLPRNELHCHSYSFRGYQWYANYVPKIKGGDLPTSTVFLRGRNDKPQQQCDEEKRRKDFTIRRPYKRNTSCVEYKNKCHTANKRGICHHFKIINKVHERTCKSQHQRKTVQPYWVPRIYFEKYCYNSTKCLSQNIASTTYCNHRTPVYRRNSVMSTYAIAHIPYNQ